MTGEQWMAEKLKEFTALASGVPPEKAAALLELLGGDQTLLDQVVTTKAAPPTFHDLLGNVSNYLVQRRGS